MMTKHMGNTVFFVEAVGQKRIEGAGQHAAVVAIRHFSIDDLGFRLAQSIL